MTRTLDVSDHARFLDGYLDAVGRVRSTDSTLAAAGTRLVVEDGDLERKLRVQLSGRRRIENPAKEVESTVATVLGPKADAQLRPQNPRECLDFAPTSCWSFCSAEPRSHPIATPQCAMLS